MVRTRAEATTVRVSAKAPRKVSTPVASSPAGKSSKRYEGGNSYCPRETPYWQKEITTFFTPKTQNNSDGAGSSRSMDNNATNSSQADDSGNTLESEGKKSSDNP